MKFNLRFIKIALLFLFGSSTVWLSAQSPYRFEKVKDGLLLGIPIGIHTYNLINNGKFKGLTKEKARLLRPVDIWTVDRWAVKNYPTGKTARTASDVLMYSSFALPLTMLASERGRDGVEAMSALYAETLLINSALTNLTKALVKRTRPFAYNEFVDINLKLDKNVRKSFFSGHTSTTAAMSFLTAKMYSDFYPESDLKPLVWTTAALVPAITGFLRMRGGKHFFTDVLVGFVVGAAVGVLVPEVHRIGD